MIVGAFLFGRFHGLYLSSCKFFIFGSGSLQLRLWEVSRTVTAAFLFSGLNPCSCVFIHPRKYKKVAATESSQKILHPLFSFGG